MDVFASGRQCVVARVNYCFQQEVSGNYGTIVEYNVP